MALSFSTKLGSQSAEPAPDLTEFDLGYYGWRVVLAACLGVMAGFGSLFVYTFAVFVKPLSAEFGWNREAISLRLRTRRRHVGPDLPAAGPVDRPLWSSPHHSSLHDGVWLRDCFRWRCCTPHLWQFYVTCFVLGLVGNGAAHLAYSRSISTWFQRRLGMALAFVMVGAGLGAMILPVVAQAIISRVRLASSVLFRSAVLPCYSGCRSAGAISESVAWSSASPAPVSHSGMTWQQGLRSFAFWIIVAILFVSSISMNGAITHLSALLTDRGITAEECGAYARPCLVVQACLAGSVLAGCWTDFSGRASRL